MYKILQTILKKQLTNILEMSYNTTCKVKTLDRWCLKLEKILEQSLLYDFYGELLTEHQKSIYEDFVLNDLSLSEIAQDKEISRQGVYDIVKRCNKILEGYEQKLHLIEKFLMAKVKVEEIRSKAEMILDNPDNEDLRITCVKDIECLSSEIMDEF